MTADANALGTDIPGGDPDLPRLQTALTAAGAAAADVADCRPLGGGTFNAVYLVTLADGTRLVVKLPPGPQVPLLRYERGIVGTEALYYELAARCAGVRVPALIAADAKDPAGGYLVMEHCPGSPWPEVEPPPAGEERAELRAEIGRQVARLHTMTGDRFGYPSGAVGPLRETWRAAFGDMIDAVLADAGRYAVTLPRPIGEVQDWFAALAPVLDEVSTPVLVHFDLWDGNVLVDSRSGRRQIGGLIDAERAFWGDPLAELVSLALFGDIEADAAFLRGYRSAGGMVTFDRGARQRLSLYRAYLYLIMLVEVVPRQSGPAWQARLAELVFSPLAAILGA